MKNIHITTQKKSHILRVIASNLSFFSFFVGSFYVNHKFIGGNNFLDTALFLLFIVVFYAIAIKGNTVSYFGIKKDKVKKIQEILEE